MKTIKTLALIALTLAGCWFMAGLAAWSFIGLAMKATDPLLQGLFVGLGIVGFGFWTFAAGSWTASLMQRFARKI